MGVAALAAALAGCGDDKEPSSSVERVYRAPTTGQTTPEDVPVTPAPSTPTTETAPPEPPPASTTPDDEGGDEEPARTEVTLTGTSSGITPRQAGVAPYISVKLTLVSKDGSAHTLRIAGRTLTVGGTRKSMFVTLTGLPPGKSYRGRSDDGKTIRILSSSEPGP